MPTRPGLRERKKQATREALQAAALRLALEKGPENVRVDEIAEAADVSPRTYNNYFPSREHAIVAAVTEDRRSRLAADILATPADVGLADAVVDAVVARYADPGEPAQAALLMITTSPALRTVYVETAGAVDDPVRDAIIERMDGVDRLVAEVLAGAVAAAVRIALRSWLRPTSSGLVIPSTRPLDEMLRAALAPLRPALKQIDTHEAG